jgi:hypothetical protein
VILQAGVGIARCELTASRAPNHQNGAGQAIKITKDYERTTSHRAGILNYESFGYRPVPSPPFWMKRISHRVVFGSEGGGCSCRVLSDAPLDYRAGFSSRMGMAAVGAKRSLATVREETPEASTVNRSKQIRRQSRLQPWGCEIKEGADFQRQKTAPEIDDIDGQRRRFEGFEHDLQLAVSNGVGDMI